MSVKFPFFGGGGGKCRFYFYGRADFSDQTSVPKKPPLLGVPLFCKAPPRQFQPPKCKVALSKNTLRLRSPAPHTNYKNPLSPKFHKSFPVNGALHQLLASLCRTAMSPRHMSTNFAQQRSVMQMPTLPISNFSSYPSLYITCALLVCFSLRSRTMRKSFFCRNFSSNLRGSMGISRHLPSKKFVAPGFQGRTQTF